MCLTPVIVPGPPGMSKPTSAVPGLTPKSPVIEVGPLLVTVEPPNTTKLLNSDDIATAAAGWVAFAPVVNVQVAGLGNGLPLVSFTPEVTCAVKSVLGGKGDDGVKVAVFDALSNATAPGTTAPLGPTTLNVEVVTVEPSIGLLKFAVTALFNATPVAAFAGLEV
jgi:hypothetical protein